MRSSVVLLTTVSCLSEKKNEVKTGPDLLPIVVVVVVVVVSNQSGISTSPPPDCRWSIGLRAVLSQSHDRPQVSIMAPVVDSLQRKLE